MPRTTPRALCLVTVALTLGSGCAVQEAPPPVSAAPQGEDRSPVLNLVAEKEAQLQQWKETAEELRASLEKTRSALERNKSLVAELREERDTLVAEDTLLRSSLQTLDAERRDLLERLAEQELAALRRERSSLEDSLIRLEAFGHDPLADAEPEAEEGYVDFDQAAFEAAEEDEHEDAGHGEAHDTGHGEEPAPAHDPGHAPAHDDGHAAPSQGGHHEGSH
jgi:septal ring factor EnvC (AmiA/AmiB activator)